MVGPNGLIQKPTPLNVNKYLSILFEGIESFVLDEDNSNIILGLKAVNGEILKFGWLINVGKKSLNDALDKWLLKIEYQMRYSMSIKLNNMLDQYNIFKKLFIKCNNKIYYYGYEFYGDISYNQYNGCSNKYTG